MAAEQPNRNAREKLAPVAGGHAEGLLAPAMAAAQQPYGPVPFRWRYSPPSINSTARGSADSSVTSQVDTTSGMDEAIRQSGALADTVAGLKAALYGGGGSLDLGSIMAATDRIRALKGYLSAFGPVSESMPYPMRIPLARLAGVSSTSRSSADAQTSTSTGGWDAYQ